MARRLQKCEDHEDLGLGYLAAFEDAEIRMARGERQYKCAECGLYNWPRPPARTESG
jgi:hypothetical protein